MKLWRIMIAMLWSLPVIAFDPFTVTFSQSGSGTANAIRVELSVPEKHHVYADAVSLKRADHHALRQIGGDQPVRVHDAFTDSDRDAFTNDVTLLYEGIPAVTTGDTVAFSYQGCSEKECFFPGRKTYVVQGAGVAMLPEKVFREGTVSATREEVWASTWQSHRTAARAVGYLAKADFLDFLAKAEGRGVPEHGAASMWDRIKAGFGRFSDDPAAFLKTHGMGFTLLLILVGGLLLNLTPCVLPMIPINLAILGVGTQGSSNVRGFMLGAAYGTGIAFVYGTLGLVVVLTGAQFGTLNSLPGFNLVIAVLFVLLALAMFDVFTIDLSRFQGMNLAGAGSKRGGIVAAFMVGGVTALLAGACVAPVVIAVLLLSGNLYAQGVRAGLILPFVLGLGMALPWPLAGAGLACLPKPGAWMTRIKYGFGVFILVVALYYFSLAYRSWHHNQGAPDKQAGAYAINVTETDQWRAILRESEISGKPVLVDFWATWCKNCEAMEVTTFKDHTVRERLAGYLVVKLQVEKPAESEAKGVIDAFEIKGLPTYVVLSPKGAR